MGNTRTDIQRLNYTTTYQNSTHLLKKNQLTCLYGTDSPTSQKTTKETITPPDGITNKAFSMSNRLITLLFTPN